MIRRITMAAAGLAVMLAGLTLVTTTSATADVGRYPHAAQNWFNFECIGFKKINGPVPYPLGAVVSEYGNKVASRSSVPPLRTGNNCQSVRGDHGVVGVNAVRKTGANNDCESWGVRWDPGPNRIALNLRCPNSQRREFMCSGVGQAIGAHGYTGPFAGRKGCLWFDHTGPNHLSKREARVIRQAWDRNPGDRGTHWDRAVGVGMLDRGTDYHNRMSADPKRVTTASFSETERIAVANGMPCRYSKSNHCTYGAQYRGGKGDQSFWRGSTVRKHLITNKRANIRMTQWFRYHNWGGVGNVDGHPSCWTKGSDMRCKDGYYRNIDMHVALV